MAPSPYRYRALQTPNTIRLLRILPELKDGEIACTLEHFQDDAVPPYHTLSYVWGDPKKTREIRIKDVDAESWYKHGLHENLWEFLDQMHTLRSHQNDYYIWTDFLCLDQGSTTEMNQQVQRMGHIYSGAARTIAWLGRPSSTSSPGLQSLQDELDWIPDWLSRKRQDAEKLPPFIRARYSKWWTFTNPEAWEAAFWSTNSTYGNRELNSEDVLPLGSWYIPFHKILCLPYWKRAWIVQEVALSKRVDLVFGVKSIDIEEFFLAYKVHMHHMSRGSGTDEQFIVADAARRTPRGELSIFRILEWAELCISTQPLDRVYSLLGLMEARESEESLMPMLEANYEKKVVELYWDVVLACCRSSPLIPGAISIVMDRVQKLLQCSNTLETFKAYAENKRTSNINRTMAVNALELVPTFRALSPFNGIQCYVAPSLPVPSSWKLSTVEAGWDHVFYHPQMDEYGSFLKLAIMFLLRGNEHVTAQNIQATLMAALLASRDTNQGQWVCQAHMSTVDSITSANKTNGTHFEVLRPRTGMGKLLPTLPSTYTQAFPICSQSGETPCDNTLLVLNTEKLGCSLSFSPSTEKKNLGDLVVFKL